MFPTTGKHGFFCCRRLSLKRREPQRELFLVVLLTSVLLILLVLVLLVLLILVLLVFVLLILLILVSVLIILVFHFLHSPEPSLGLIFLDFHQIRYLLCLAPVKI